MSTNEYDDFNKYLEEYCEYLINEAAEIETAIKNSTDDKFLLCTVNSLEELQSNDLKFNLADVNLSTHLKSFSLNETLKLKKAGENEVLHVVIFYNPHDKNSVWMKTYIFSKNEIN